MRKVQVVAALLLLVTACMTPSQPGTSGGVTPTIDASMGSEFDIAVGQEAKVQGSSINIRFGGVAEDSRCPSDVQCVWAGDAVVRVSLSGAGPTDVSLHTTLDPKAVQYAGRTITLVGLKPVPRSGTKIPALEYVATLRVN
jgi:hypothetical protein